MDSEQAKKAAIILMSRGGFGPETPHRGVFQQVIALIGRAPVTWCGGDLTQDGGLLSGRIWFVTDHVIAIADIKGARPGDEDTRPDSDGHVDVRVIARRSLKSVALPGDAQAELQGGTWFNMNGSWPSSASMELQYEMLDAPLVIRPRDTIGDFLGLVDTLVRDLRDE